VYTPHELRRSPNRSLTALLALFVLALGASRVVMAQEVLPHDRELLLKGQLSDAASIVEKLGYPGPKQVLALKAELGLTREQLKKTEALEKVFGISAVAKGEEVVQAEDELVQLFEAGTVTEKVLRSKLEQIGKLRAELRFIHLQAFLRMKQILTSDQVKLYSELLAREARR
jgi:Spy/CpxP family protein refolding chaperone